jgi:hypothetical protein
VGRDIQIDHLGLGIRLCQGRGEIRPDILDMNRMLYPVRTCEPVTAEQDGRVLAQGGAEGNICSRFELAGDKMRVTGGKRSAKPAGDKMAEARAADSHR